MTNAAPDDTPPLGIGLIGLGVMGRRMAQALAVHPRWQVVAGFDPAAAEVPGVPRLDSADAVARHPGVRCVYIASPPAAHLAHLQAAAAAGKAVFCEKPLAASVAEAQAGVQVLRAAGVAAGVNFPFSTSAGARGLAALVAEGRLGELREARLTLRFAQWPRPWQADAAGWLAAPAQGGFTREVGSHFLFLAGRLFGTGQVESAHLRRGVAGTEESLQAVVRYPALRLVIDAQVAGEVADHNRFEVVGSADRAALTDWQRLNHQGALTPRADGLPGQLDALAALVAGTPGHGLATPEEAADVVRLVEGLLAT